MTSKPYSSNDKWVVAIVGALLFLLLSSPYLYSNLNNLTSSFGMIIADDGCPNLAGMILAALLFMLIVRLLMW
jgi:hypothetical protein